MFLSNVRLSPAVFRLQQKNTDSKIKPVKITDLTELITLPRIFHWQTQSLLLGWNAQWLLDIYPTTDHISLRTDVMFTYIHYNEDVLPGVHEFLLRIWRLGTPCIACWTSSKKLFELWMFVPPKTIRTPKLFLFNWWTASDSSYIAPPIINTMISCGL